MLQEFSGDFIQWLRGFYYTATCGTISAAMKEMHRNQSAITYQIKSLEKEFGVKLFSGTKNNRVLTEEGKLLLTRASQLFNFINELKSQLASLPSNLHGELNISAMYSFYNHLLPQLVERFANRHPDISFNLHAEKMENELFEDVSSGKADIGILSSACIPDEFITVPIFKTDLVLLTPLKIRLEPNQLTLDHIAGLRLGASPLKSSLWLNICRQSQQYGVVLKPKHIVEHQDCLIRCVAAGLCCAILDSFVLEDFSCAPQVNVYSLSNIFNPRQYYLIMQKMERYHYPQVRAFYRFLMAEFEVPEAQQP